MDREEGQKEKNQKKRKTARPIIFSVAQINAKRGYPYPNEWLFRLAVPRLRGVAGHHGGRGAARGVGGAAPLHHGVHTHSLPAHLHPRHAPQGRTEHELAEVKTVDLKNTQ